MKKVTVAQEGSQVEPHRAWHQWDWRRELHRESPVCCWELIHIGVWTHYRCQEKKGKKGWHKWYPEHAHTGNRAWVPAFPIRLGEEWTTTHLQDQWTWPLWELSTAPVSIHRESQDQKAQTASSSFKHTTDYTQGHLLVYRNTSPL